MSSAMAVFTRPDPAFVTATASWGCAWIDAVSYPEHWQPVALKTLVYLLRPQMASAFDVQVVVEKTQTARVVGAEVGKVAKFLERGQSPALFELEYESTLYQRCRLHEEAAADSLRFVYDSSTLLDVQSTPGVGH